MFSSTTSVYRNILCRSKPASPRGGFWRVIGSFPPVSASPTFGRLTPFSTPSDAQNGPSGLSFSESFGLVPIRPLVENPVFMRVFRPSIFSGFDSDTLTTRRFELPSDGCLRPGSLLTDRCGERVPANTDVGDSLGSASRGLDSVPEWSSTLARCSRYVVQYPPVHFALSCLTDLPPSIPGTPPVPEAVHP